MSKQKYATWEKLAKAVNAAEAELVQRREASRPQPKASSGPTPPRWAGADPFEHVKKALAKHKAMRAAALDDCVAPKDGSGSESEPPKPRPFKF